MSLTLTQRADKAAADAALCRRLHLASKTKAREAINLRTRCLIQDIRASGGHVPRKVERDAVR